MDKTIEFEGIEVSVPSDMEELDVDVIEAFEDQQAIPFVRALVGPTKWKQLKAQFAARHGRNMRFKDVVPLFEAIGKVYGFESVGESSGSEDSSTSTSEPSTPTSTASTGLTSTTS